MLAFALALSAIPACLSQLHYTPPELTLPPTPALPQPYESGYVNLSTVDIWYAQFGTKLHECIQQGASPILFLHGGFANADYFGNQISALLDSHEQSTIIAIDSRMQGRSTGVFTQPISYDLMRDDVIGVLDHFGIPKATVVGWSDGAIIGLDLAINNPSRLERLFAFAGSYAFTNTNATAFNSSTFQAYLARAKEEYQKLSPSPKGFPTLYTKINDMFNISPNYTQSDVAKIPTLYQACSHAPLIWVVDAADEEVINLDVPRTLHGWIPASGLVILPSVSHFA